MTLTDSAMLRAAEQRLRDHLATRPATGAEAEEIRRSFLAMADRVDESDVYSRPHAEFFRLHARAWEGDPAAAWEATRDELQARVAYYRGLVASRQHPGKTAISRCERCGLELHGDRPATGDCPRCGEPDRATTWVTRWLDPPAARYAVDTSTDPPTLRVGDGDLIDFHDVLDRLEATGKTSVQIVAATDQVLDRARRIDRRLYELGWDVLPWPGGPDPAEPDVR